jgi:hypothetical protein
MSATLPPLALSLERQTGTCRSMLANHLVTVIARRILVSLQSKSSTGCKAFVLCGLVLDELIHAGLGGSRSAKDRGKISASSSRLASLEWSSGRGCLSQLIVRHVRHIGVDRRKPFSLS